MEYPYLHVQLWDQDVVSWNDCIAETTLDMTSHIKKALKKGVAYHFFTKPLKKKKKPLAIKDAKKKPAAAGAPKKAGDVKAADASDAPPKAEAEAATGVEMVAVTEAKVAPVPVEGGAVSDTKPLLDDGVLSSDAFDAPPKEDASLPPAPKLVKAVTEEKDDEAPLLAPDEEDAEPDARAVALARRGEQQDEAREAINQLKGMIGMGDDPPHTSWLDMKRRNFDTQEYEDMGKVLLSIELLPGEMAKKRPAGFGRSEPNANPYLPPPTGRMKFSLNPFYVLEECLGPKLCRRIMCLCCCAGMIAACVFGAPFFDVVIQTINAFPSWAQYGVLIILVGLITFCCGYGTYRRMCKKEEGLSEEDAARMEADAQRQAQADELDQAEEDQAAAEKQPLLPADGSAKAV
jgi:hypothetical protein